MAAEAIRIEATIFVVLVLGTFAVFFAIVVFLVGDLNQAHLVEATLESRSLQTLNLVSAL